MKISNLISITVGGWSVFASILSPCFLSIFNINLRRVLPEVLLRTVVLEMRWEMLNLFNHLDDRDHAKESEGRERRLRMSGTVSNRSKSETETGYALMSCSGAYLCLTLSLNSQFPSSRGGLFLAF